MKETIKKFGLPISIGLMLCVITIFGLVTSCLKTKMCTDPNYPLSCSSAKSCCPTDKPWNDEHGTCWVDLGSCRYTGNACEECWPE